MKYDPCEDCLANGDDYYIDDDGEMVKACGECPWREEE